MYMINNYIFESQMRRDSGSTSGVKAFGVDDVGSCDINSLIPRMGEGVAVAYIWMRHMIAEQHIPHTGHNRSVYD
jgi:hypothetical protein